MKSSSKSKKRISNIGHIEPANDNSPTCAKFEFEALKDTNSSVSQGECGVAVYSNFPEFLPILKSELVLMQGYLAEFVNSILANDNEPNN
tara:strand:- start:1757 stop:2026 length:270 start_codon:yes stop_codon:yes gene_type:complete